MVHAAASSVVKKEQKRRPAALPPLEPVGYRAVTAAAARRSATPAKSRADRLRAFLESFTESASRNQRFWAICALICRLDAARLEVGDRGVFAECDQSLLELPRRISHKPRSPVSIPDELTDDFVDALDLFRIRFQIYVANAVAQSAGNAELVTDDEAELRAAGLAPEEIAAWKLRIQAARNSPLSPIRIGAGPAAAARYAAPIASARGQRIDEHIDSFQANYGRVVRFLEVSIRISDLDARRLARGDRAYFRAEDQECLEVVRHSAFRMDSVFSMDDVDDVMLDRLERVADSFEAYVDIVDAAARLAETPYRPAEANSAEVVAQPSTPPRPQPISTRQRVMSDQRSTAALPAVSPTPPNLPEAQTPPEIHVATGSNLRVPLAQVVTSDPARGSETGAMDPARPMPATTAPPAEESAVSTEQGAAIDQSSAAKLLASQGARRETLTMHDGSCPVGTAPSDEVGFSISPKYDNESLQIARPVHGRLVKSTENRLGSVSRGPGPLQARAPWPQRESGWLRPGDSYGPNCTNWPTDPLNGIIGKRLATRWRDRLPWIWPYPADWRIEFLEDPRVAEQVSEGAPRLQPCPKALVIAAPCEGKRIYCHVQRVLWGKTFVAVRIEPVGPLSIDQEVLLRREVIECADPLRVALDGSSMERRWLGIELVARRAKARGRRGKVLDLDFRDGHSTRTFLQATGADVDFVSCEDIRHGDDVYFEEASPTTADFMNNIRSLHTCVTSAFCLEPEWSLANRYSIPPSLFVYGLGGRRCMVRRVEEINGVQRADLLRFEYIPDPNESEYPEYDHEEEYLADLRDAAASAVIAES